ncbi:MAG TPA: hypothetical protein VF604_05675 [Pyrinomonadaceae bacterium]|jgi:hypothetical protein
MINLQDTVVKGLNPYYRSAKISEPKTRQIIGYFALDLTAKKNQAGKFADLAVNGVA